MRSPGRVPALLFLAGGLLALGPPRASAEFEPIRLISKDALEQADSASEPALSADGRYVAFQASLGGREGVFREDLETGEVVPVATGSAYLNGSPGADADAPSISADGRYVSFTTAAPLDPADDHNDAEDVYVADMATSPPTYELASALDGSSQGLSYQGGGGSLASGRVALSADGREVVFVTTAASDLGGAAGDTPAGQVVLRDLETRQTTLVSVERDPLTGAMEPGVPVAGGAVAPFPAGASLSADGTTVAWLGTDLPAQVPMLADEQTKIRREDEIPGDAYDEPLWRRVADGPGAPTRRIVGGGDPLAPGCPGEGGTLAEPACRGPFPAIDVKDEDLNSAQGWLGLHGVDGVPQLSADGRTVALIGNPEEGTDLFLVDMSPGLDRDQALRPLTRWTVVDPQRPGATINTEPYIPLTGDIFDLAISPDGTRVAFTSARQQFPLSPPSLVDPPPDQVGMVELYMIDLQRGTIERLTPGTGAGPSLGPVAQAARAGIGATSPSFGEGGGELAFASAAGNLVEGDANGASDVFVTEEAPPGPGGGSTISPAPPPVTGVPLWRLSARAVSLPDGSVRLLAVVPAAGRLRARAEAAPGSAARGLIAAASGRPRGPGALRLTVPLRPALRRLARVRGGTYASLLVSFSAPGGRTLHADLQARFRLRGGKPGGAGG